MRLHPVTPRREVGCATLLVPTILAVLTLLLSSGCQVAPVTYRTHSSLASKIQELKNVQLAAPDVEVSEVSAGGVSEKRDDWTEAVGKNLLTAVSAETKCTPLFDHLDGAQKTQIEEELLEVQALLRAITLNQLTHGPGINQLASTTTGPMTYNVGRIDNILDAAGADSLVIVFARDSYATAGRKTLAVLGMLAGAAAGVAIVPGTGTSTVSSAALVERDGTVLWFNLVFSPDADLRDLDGAQDFTETLLAGFPKT